MHRFSNPRGMEIHPRMLRVYIISRGLQNGEEYATVPGLIIPRIIRRFLSLGAMEGAHGNAYFIRNG